MMPIWLTRSSGPQTDGVSRVVALRESLAKPPSRKYRKAKQAKMEITNTVGSVPEVDLIKADWQDQRGKELRI